MAWPDDIDFATLLLVSLTQHLEITARRVRTRCTNWFFANFFRLLLAVVSLSEWGVFWWVFPGSVGALPLLVQLAGPAVIYAVNAQLAGRTRQTRTRRDGSPVNGMPRLYYALAFTCLFCFMFLLLTGGVWISAKVVIEAIAVQAGTTHAAPVIGSGVDTGFRWFANAGIALITTAFMYGYTIGQWRLRVVPLSVALNGNSAGLEGLRIAQISDIHIGQNLTRAQLERFVAQVNALSPDLICITGDIADSPHADLETFLPILAQLRAPSGVFAILGNHDHYAGADQVEAALRRLTPFTVLRDEQTSIAVNDTRLHIIGLDDRGRDWARGVPAVAYLGEALASIPSDAAVLLLSHRPDIFPQAAAAGVALTLSGHTHGGQLGMPWFNGRVRNLAEFITAFDRGLFERDGSYLYVNCGLGVTGQRIRLCTPREITLIEVRGPAACRMAA